VTAWLPATPHLRQEPCSSQTRHRWGPHGDSVAVTWGHTAAGKEHQRVSPAQGGRVAPASAANWTIRGLGKAVCILDALLGFIPIFTLPRPCPRPKPCRPLELG